MFLTISKKFEISLSYRYYQPRWSAAENEAYFGREAGSEHGYGGNFVAYFVFAGDIDADTGMVINVTVIKERIKRLLAERYDHKFLNADTKPFDEIVPSPENVARYLLQDAEPLFRNEAARLVACHLTVAPESSATAYADGRLERHVGLEFSAARQTWSPHLTDEENRRLFGIAAHPSGHGHYYYLRATLAGRIDQMSGMICPPDDCRRAFKALHTLLDHRHLNIDVPELDGMPMTTESLAGFINQRLRNRLPVTRIRLWENPSFYTECLDSNRYVMGIRSSFCAAHRLHSPCLSDEQNKSVYGKCNNPAGHGHRYLVEAALDGALDEQSGTLHPLEDLIAGVRKALDRWDYGHLDEDTDDFSGRPSTGENIVSVLWPKIEDGLGRSLYRLRLWETPNNCFTLRRDGYTETQ